eukprot:3177312-Rhodomonas_salina.3
MLGQNRTSHSVCIGRSPSSPGPDRRESNTMLQCRCVSRGHLIVDVVDVQADRVVDLRTGLVVSNEERIRARTTAPGNILRSEYRRKQRK